MATLILENNKKLHFSSMLDLYNFIIDEQIVTEVWYIDEKDLSDKSKKLLEKSKKSPHLINI
jgi:hypothetical protein